MDSVFAVTLDDDRGAPPKPSVTHNERRSTVSVRRSAAKVGMLPLTEDDAVAEMMEATTGVNPFLAYWTDWASAFDGFVLANDQTAVADLDIGVGDFLYSFFEVDFVGGSGDTTFILHQHEHQLLGSSTLAALAFGTVLSTRQRRRKARPINV